jgi:hypothetical protein
MAEKISIEMLERLRDDEIEAPVQAYNQRNQEQVVIRFRDVAQIDERIKRMPPSAL